MELKRNDGAMPMNPTLYLGRELRLGGVAEDEEVVVAVLVGVHVGVLHKHRQRVSNELVGIQRRQRTFSALIESLGQTKRPFSPRKTNIVESRHLRQSKQSVGTKIAATTALGNDADGENGRPRNYLLNGMAPLLQLEQTKATEEGFFIVQWKSE